MFKTYIQTYYFIVLITLAFLLPLHPKLIPPAIIALTLGSFFLIDIKEILKNKIVMAFFAFYLLHIVSLIYTANIDSGLFDLQVKLSLIIFPVALFPVAKLSTDQIKKIFFYFIFGCVVALIICLHIAYWNYIYEQWCIKQSLWSDNYGINFFISSRFSYFIHPSYFSMYLCLALTILLTVELNIRYKIIFKICASALLILGIILLASKAGIIVLALLILYFLYSLKNKIYSLLILLFFIFSITSLFYFSPEFGFKFKSMFSVFNSEKSDIKTEESSESRVNIWSSALEVVTQNPITGYGTGDVSDKLKEVYAKNGYTGLEEKSLNAHNQFLQTLIGLGLPGLILLLYILFRQFKTWLVKREIIGIALIVILTFNFLVESVIETQAGVVFFSFWLMFFSYSTKSQGETKNQ